MADNQYSRRHASRIEDLPENDPLAELARIVGFGPEPVAVPKKSEIDLESELLRELGVFDSASEQPAAVPEHRQDDFGDGGDSTAEPERFADGSVEISLEDELLFDIEDGYRAHEAVANKHSDAPVFSAGGDDAANVDVSEADPHEMAAFSSSDETAIADDGEQASAWEEDSAEEFDALARHEAIEEVSDDRVHAAFDPIDAYAVGHVETHDLDGAPHADASAEEEPWPDHGEPAAESTAIRDASSDEGDLPFIALSHPDDEADEQHDIVSIDAFALEAELAAELDSDAIAEAAVADDRIESDGEFHPHQLFDPAPEAWRDEEGTQERVPTLSEEDEPRAFVASDDTESAEVDVPPIVSLAPPAQGHSSDDILADIERFEITPSDESAVAWTASEPVARSEERDEATSETAAPDLDDWLREMTGDEFGSGAYETLEATAQGEPEEPENHNVVPLWPAAEAEMETEGPSAELHSAGEDDFVSDDMADLDAALEADLAAVHEEILSEAEFGRSDEVAEARSFETSDDDRADAAEFYSEVDAYSADDPALAEHDAGFAAADEGEKEETRAEDHWEDSRVENQGFVFPVFEPPAVANPVDHVSPDQNREIATTHGPSPANLEAVASRETGVSDSFEFDPAALADTEETVELLGDLDIPDVSREIDEAPAAAAHDEFDLDMESDFAELLDNEQAEAAVPENSARVAEIAAAGLAGGAAATATAAYGREQTTAVAPAGVTFDYSDIERGLEGGIADGLTEDPGLLSPFEDDRQQAAVPVAAASGASSNRRRLMLMGGVAGFVVIAGLGLLAWNSGDLGQGTDGPRVIAANPKPAKEKPADPGGKTVPNQNKVVYDSVDGTMSQTPEQKNLVTTAEKPVDVVQRTLDPDVLPLGQQPRDVSPADDSTGDAAQAGGAAADAPKGQDRLAPEVTQDGASREAPRGVEPHRVQTMVVTADGKLIPRDDGQQPSASGASSTAAPPAETLKPTSPESQPQAMSAPGAASDSPAASPLAAPRPSPRPVEAASEPAAPAAKPAPAAQEPDSQPAAATPPAAETAAAAPAAQAKPADNPGGYFIQIASQPTEAGANASYKNLSARYSSVLGGHGVDIQRADISGKGVYYRVRIPAGSRQEAISLCENYRGAGGSCFVTR